MRGVEILRNYNFVGPGTEVEAESSIWEYGICMEDARLFRCNRHTPIPTASRHQFLCGNALPASH